MSRWLSGWLAAVLVLTPAAGYGQKVREAHSDLPHRKAGEEKAPGGPDLDRVKQLILNGPTGSARARAAPS
jgi:hypothetical protein